MALRAAFSMIRIITGVASTCGNMASLNRLAGCSGCPGQERPHHRPDILANNEGGHRRLNVAVTRARRELLVFSTLRPEPPASTSVIAGKADQVRVNGGYRV
jgi:hypothetical protein